MRCVTPWIFSQGWVIQNCGRHPLETRDSRFRGFAHKNLYYFFDGL